MIVKANDDCRQEVLAMQLMTRLHQIFKKSGSNIWLRPYEILITSSDSAMIEYLSDTISVHGLKRKLLALKGGDMMTLTQFYRWYYGSRFEEA